MSHRFCCLTKRHVRPYCPELPLQYWKLLRKQIYGLQIVYASGGVVIYDSGLCADGTVVYLAGCVVPLLTGALWKTVLPLSGLTQWTCAHCGVCTCAPAPFEIVLQHAPASQDAVLGYASSGSARCMKAMNNCTAWAAATHPELHIKHCSALTDNDLQELVLDVETGACRGIVFGTIYGGIIYPPQQATYFPPAIVSVVIFGPVFAQSWFIGPVRSGSLVHDHLLQTRRHPHLQSQ